MSTVVVAPSRRVRGAGAVSGTEELVERDVLDSGLRVVTEQVPGARSVTLGVYATIGSRDEPEELAGASHFLEHLLFKGTDRRTARDIAQAVDAVGGEMNAFTGRETTAYYLRLPAAELVPGLDLLADVISAPAFRPDEVDAEREVIVEELLMSADDPDDVVHQALYEAVFPTHPLGRETLGSMETIPTLHRDAIADFHAAHYRPANLVLSVAGDLDHDLVVERAATRFGHAGSGHTPPRTRPADALDPLRVIGRDTEQVHLQLGWRAFDTFDDDRWALHVANHVLGGGMASRLFHEVREARGLAYSVFSSPALYTDSGLFQIVASTGRGRLDQLLAVIDDVVEELLAHGVTDHELAVARGYLEGATLLSLEDTGSRMARLASNEVLYGEQVTVEEQLDEVRAVSSADVVRVLRRVLDAPRVVAAVGADAGDPALERAAAWRRS